MSAETHILAIDSEQKTRSLTKRYLKSVGYFCDTVASASQALDLLEENNYDLVLTDVKMTHENSISLLNELGKSHPNLAVIIMTSAKDTDLAMECLEIGAYDYVFKPFKKDALNIVVQRALNRRHLLSERRAYRLELEKKVHARTMEVVRAYHEIENTYQQTLEALVSALDFREQSTAGHSKRAVDYSRLLAIELGFRGDRLVPITRGALLHDVGKIGISDSILLKPGQLTKREWKVMKMHPIYGYQMLKDIRFLQPSLDIILHHHERYDGNGYPNGLAKLEIPIGARIFAVIDAFDAITSHRVYRAAKDFEKAYDILKENAGTQFDPHAVDAFLQIPKERLQKIFRNSLIHDDKKGESPEVGSAK